MTEPSSSSADGGYLFDNRASEAGPRFDSLAELFNPVTFRHLDALGIAAGWQCWEVGVGGPRFPSGCLESRAIGSRARDGHRRDLDPAACRRERRGSSTRCRRGRRATGRLRSCPRPTRPHPRSPARSGPGAHGGGTPSGGMAPHRGLRPSHAAIGVRRRGGARTATGEQGPGRRSPLLANGAPTWSLAGCRGCCERRAWWR